MCAIIVGLYWLYYLERLKPIINGFQRLTAMTSGQTSHVLPSSLYMSLLYVTS